MLLAARVPWHKLAKQCADNMLDPSHVFEWPFARVLAVYLLDAARGETVTTFTDAAAFKAHMAAVRAKKREQSAG